LFWVGNNFSKINLNWGYIKCAKTYVQKTMLMQGFAKLTLGTFKTWVFFFFFWLERGPSFPRLTWLGATLVLQKPTSM
jgi:hypothetical protein